MKDRTFRFLEEKLNIDYEIRHPLALNDIYSQHPLIANEVTSYFVFSKKSLSHPTINKLRKAFIHLEYSDEFQQILNSPKK